MQNLELFARKCTCCGGGMNQGFVIGGGAEYYCSDDCLNQHYTPEEWKEMTAEEEEDDYGFSLGSDDNYWTEWDTEDDDELEYVLYKDEVIDREDLKPRVLREDFLNWLFSDSDDAQGLGIRVMKDLMISGTSTISVDELFYECGYIPAHILENAEMFEEDQEFDPSEVVLLY